MEYRPLGRTGVKVSPLCLGCMTFGEKTDDDTAADMIDTALDAGINFIDTADIYNKGKSEQAVGKALQRNGRREHVILATKVHGRMDKDEPNSGGNHRRHMIEGCEKSLERLQTDWIDLYQLHRPDPGVPVDETLRAMDDLITAGKVNHFGFSTYPGWKIMEALWASSDLGLNRVVCEQPPYHLLDRRIERELVPLAQTYGLAVIPWSPLAGGFLTGKYTRENPAEVAGRHGGEKPWLNDHFTEPAFKVVDVLKALAEAKDVTPSQVALAWCMHQPAITSPIIGPRTPEQLDDNLGALDVDITDDDREKLDDVSPPGTHLVSYYESQAWGAPRHSWKG